MSADQHHDLLQRIAKGDIAALESLYNALFPVAIRVARRLLGKDTEAEDLVHEVFLHLWENRNSIGSIDRIESYVLTMVRNRAYNVIRHDKHVKYSEISSYSSSGESLPPAMGSPSSIPGDTLENDELSAAIRKAIDSLPEQQRRIVGFRWNTKLSYEAIAAETGLTVKAVRLQLERAYKTLRPVLEHLVK